MKGRVVWHDVGKLDSSVLPACGGGGGARGWHFNPVLGWVLGHVGSGGVGWGLRLFVRAALGWSGVPMDLCNLLFSDRVPELA